MQCHPSEHRGGEQPHLPGPRHQPRNGGSGAQAHQSPSRSEQGGPGQQRTVDGTALRNEVAVGQKWLCQSPPPDQIAGHGRDQRGTHDIEEGRIPGAGNVQKRLYARRVDHVRQGEAGAEDDAHNEAGEKMAHVRPRSHGA